MSDTHAVSDSAPVDQPTSTGANFSSNDCGQTYGSAQGTAPLLPEGGWLAINGNTDLSQCVVGPSDASISQAYVSNRAPLPAKYGYCIWVYGQGPSGFDSGRFELIFTDQSNSSYSLTLFSSTPAWHFVEYNSDAPGITQISWKPWQGPL
ncbi:hypothetical protein GCM10009087_23610 [Sphingomonas oligophenolica]|uniref:Uncharacterized protein n=1 Tax=Sphingomonas oligophenolica TaxID=301154 RepID=A0ABU9Y1G8_9SPHN